MKIVGKFLMPFAEKFELDLAQGAEILRIDVVDGHPFLWAVIDTEAPTETRYFEAYKTGGQMSEGSELEYIGCMAIHIQMELMLYVFEVTNVGN